MTIAVSGTEMPGPVASHGCVYREASYVQLTLPWMNAHDQRPSRDMQARRATPQDVFEAADVKHQFRRGIRNSPPAEGKPIAFGFADKPALDSAARTDRGARKRKFPVARPHRRRRLHLSLDDFTTARQRSSKAEHRKRPDCNGASRRTHSH